MNLEEKNGITIIITRDFTLCFDLGEYEKLCFAGKMAELMREKEKVEKWLNKPEVSQKQKELALPMHHNMLHSINFLCDIMKRAKMTEEEIFQENLPF